MNEKMQRRNLIYFFIACIVISTIFTFNLSNSRYIDKITADDNILAIPVFTVSNNTQICAIENILPGGEEEFTFSVSNIDGEKSNEILLTYCFKLDLSSEIPLEVKLYDITDGKEQELQIINGTTEELEMNAVEQELDKIQRDYKVKIMWDINNNNYEYSGKEINLNITLEAVQKETIIFLENFETLNYDTKGTTNISLSNGIITLTSTERDPYINMYNITEFSPKKYRYIDVRYKTKETDIQSDMEFYMIENPVNDMYVLRKSIITDGKWHTITFDLWSNNAVKSRDKITGWRWDYVTASDITIDVDYIKIRQ